LDGGCLAFLIRAAMNSQWVVRTLLVVWAAAMTMVGACLMVGHWVPLPGPALDNERPSAFVANLPSQAMGQWAVWHFLYADCPCSRRVLEHNLAHSPGEGVWERIVLIGGDAELAARARARGYDVDQVSPEQLKSKYGVEAVPLLVVIDPEQAVRYVGGYTSRKQGLDNQYQRILADLLAGTEVQAIPVYGCAVSQNLRSMVDPLGLKTKP
jgi:hypothetical protein